VIDAIVVGSGPNGLVGANLLADAGWEVLVLESQGEPGGAVRTAELTLPGFHHDLFSAFYPLGAASPVIRRLRLEEFGLRWRRAPLALAHPTPDDRCAVIGPDRSLTEDSLDLYAPGDGEGWDKLMDPWDSYGPSFIDALLSPFPPIRAGLKLAHRARRRGLLELGRIALTPARRLAEEYFKGEGGALLLAGNALHADLSPETAGSGLFGWMMCGLASSIGFPVPEGGAASLTAALVRRLEAAGGQIQCGQEVTQVITQAGQARGVRTASGGDIRATRAILVDVSAPSLYQDLLSETTLPTTLADDLRRRFQWDPGTVKVDWALSAPIPWAARDARRAGTVHVADDLDELTRWSADMATHTMPARPFLLVGQQSMTDPSRQPPGCETAWAYTHVPRRVDRDGAGEIAGRWDEADVEAVIDRIESRLEERAPGFRNRILARHVFTPKSMEENDANLVGGAINGGTSQLHQELIFRPSPGTGRPCTFVRGLYLASASAHPGGGVHGACGANAARCALAAQRRHRLLGR
jgi:phytoene dehydrogenase-like protein